jgi:hypothetical protein
VFSRLRLFGGWETIDTNIRPSGTALLRPTASATRQFGGVRVRLAARTSFAVRLEDGGRVSRPVLAGPLATGVGSTSDTGSLSAELQSSAGRLTTFARYSQRDNVDSTYSSATYAQHDGAAQMFFNLSRTSQLFGIATLTNNRAATGAASTFLQVSGGGQQQMFRQGLWLRMEGSASRNHDLTTGLLMPRNAMNVGLNGQIARNTTLGVNVYLDRAPAGFAGDPHAWLARSTIRIVHTIPTGSVRVANVAGGEARGGRGTGTVTGSVYADWNANGQPDAGEEVLAGIPMALGALSHVTTGSDGQFSFHNVPSGAQQVRLDLSALPVDFDAPQAADITIDIPRGQTRRVAFGLIPLGGIRGRVYEDTNKNGQLDAGEPPIEGAVLVLDGGQRSELVRKGQFRFDAVRAGGHELELLKESLPEGAAIVGAGGRTALITREAPQIEVVYLVTIEKRPEVRKVFPAKGGGGAAAAATPRSAPAGAPAGRGRAQVPAVTRTAPAVSPTSSAREFIGAYTIQVAALTDAVNARSIVVYLKGIGFEAYLVEPPDGSAEILHRVRVGRYDSRLAAQRAVSRLEDNLGLKLWVMRAATAR